ncbi:hypothetical protein CJF30_00009553 [Rutstroemia sp. NJR-2017a BBW]|nr:hypothetical protein CJF30_00009553 [Rutstroemia sp. NJR-2017a BBW]
MHTADRFQGRDKEVVVLGLVRSNEGGNIGELLRDWRRINVAFTRAKTKLLVVGSRGTLKGRGGGGGVGGGMGKGGGEGEEEMVSRFIRLMEERNWVYPLSKEQYLGHYWEVLGTQTQASGVFGGAASQWKLEEKKRKEGVGMRRIFNQGKSSLGRVMENIIPRELEAGWGREMGLGMSGWGVS